MRRLRVTAVLALMVAPAAAMAQGITNPRTVNLDADPALEQVIPQEVCTALGAGARASVCTPDQYPQRRVVVADTCNGAPTPVVISSIQDTVDVLRIENFEDVTPRPEIFFDMRSGASGRVGDTRLVRWGDASNAACPKPRTLFRYPSRRTRGRVPRGAAYHDNYSVALRDLSKRYAGKEVRLIETYVDRNDPFCCPSFKRTSLFGYSAGKDEYVRYRTRVKRIRK